MSEPLSGEQLLGFQRDGFVVVRGVLDGDEVERLRGALQRAADDSQARGRTFASSLHEVVPAEDIVGLDGVGHLAFDERLLDIARQLLRAERLVYFGDSAIHVGEGGGRGFHKDNTNRVDPAHPDWCAPYTLIRFGLYLQDHVDHSGGLKVRRGSHNHTDITSGTPVDVPTRAGDVVVWNMRISHSGNAVRLRGLERLVLPTRVEIRLPPWLRLPEERTRMAVFISYGLDDEHLRNYVAKHADLAAYPDNYMYKKWLFSLRTEELVRLADSRGVTFLRPVPDYGKLHDLARVAEGHVTYGPSKPDHYVLHGADKWVERAFGVLRTVRDGWRKRSARA